MEIDEIRPEIKAILHDSFEGALTDLLLAKLDAKLNAMTALQLADYIDQREAQRKK